MAEFIWGTDYRQYLQNQAYVNDIRDAQKSAARNTIAAIGAGSLSILLGVEAGMGNIADAQREGAQLTADAQWGAAQLTADAQREAAELVASAQWEGAQMTAAATEHAADRVVGAIHGLDSTFRWGFGQVIGTLGGMSTSLAALIQTAKTPAQTAAYEQFEIARDAFRKCLYPECLEALGKAISGDHTSPGYKLEWRFHNLVGVVRLGFPGCDVSLVDPAAAEQSFLLATRYARADAPGDAARALFSAGWAAFVQGKLPDALRHTEGAIAIDAKFAEALFQSAKIRMAQGAPDAALPVLRRAIDLDRGYALRAAMGDSPLTVHDVTITRPFLMQATPVTQAQWGAIMGNNPSRNPKNADHPVDNVSWFDAIAYCNALSRTEGLEEAYVIDGGSSVRWKGLDALGYRLPTEAEWEYACRAGTTGDRYGDVDAVAWWEGNSGDMTHRVGQKLPNPWGFFDMLGNVLERCWDVYETYPPGAATDPVGPVDGDYRVNRGGCWAYRDAQAGERFWGKPGERCPYFGFRPVRSCPSPLPNRRIGR
jgi:formylglycine-generating enzyme